MLNVKQITKPGKNKYSTKYNIHGIKQKIAHFHQT